MIELLNPRSVADMSALTYCLSGFNSCTVVSTQTVISVNISCLSLTFDHSSKIPQLHDYALRYLS